MMMLFIAKFGDVADSATTSSVIDAFLSNTVWGPIAEPTTHMSLKPPFPPHVN